MQYSAETLGIVPVFEQERLVLVLYVAQSVEEFLFCGLL